MWLSNLAAYSLQVAVVAGAAGILPAVLRLRLPRALLVYWQVILAACLLLPLLEPWKHEQVPNVDSSAAVVVTGARAVSLPQVPRTFPVGQAVAATLAAGFVVRLLWLAAGFARLGAYRRSGRRLEKLPEAAAEMQERLGVFPEIRVSEEVRSPVTFGLRRPVLLLPARFLEMEAGPQGAIACHELLHVRRRDWAWVLFEELVRAVLWFHPAIWWLLGRIQLAREQVVDAEVIALTQARRHYLDALLAVARVPRPTVAALAPLFLSKRHFAQRVALILKEVSMSRFRLTASLTVLAAGTALAGGLAARAFPLEGAPEFIAIEAAGGGSNQEASPRPQAQKIRVGGGVQARKLISQEPPVYPPLAKQARIQGTVRFTATIAKDGTVKDVQLVNGHPLLVPAAQEAVRKWRYEPTLLNGAPVEVITQIDVNFTLSGAVPGGAGPAAAPGEAQETVTPPPFASIEPEKGVKRIRVTPADQEEKLIYRAGPMYPPLAQQAGVRGVVTCRLLIAVDGSVKAVQAVRGHPLLIPAATEAFRQYRYRPTTVDGQPAEVITEVEVKVPQGDWPAVLAPEAETPPDVYKVGPAVAAPKLIRKIEPQYSEEARDAKLMGTVVLSVVVEEDGKIRQTKVLKGLGLGLDEKAIEAVKQWEFEPALRDGKPVKVQATIEINFRLD